MALDTEHPGMFDFEPGDPKPSCPGVVQGEALVTSRESTAPGSAALCIAPDLKHPIELSRRALPVLEAEADECAICLEVFTADDPSAKTQCGFVHSFDASSRGQLCMVMSPRVGLAYASPMPNSIRSVFTS